MNDIQKKLESWKVEREVDEYNESLNQILEYKKEAVKQMRRCSDEKQMDTFAGVIMKADDMIRKVLGMYAL